MESATLRLRSRRRRGFKRRSAMSQSSQIGHQRDVARSRSALLIGAIVAALLVMGDSTAFAQTGGTQPKPAVENQKPKTAPTQSRPRTQRQDPSRIEPHVLEEMILEMLYYAYVRQGGDA